MRGEEQARAYVRTCPAALKRRPSRANRRRTGRAGARGPRILAGALFPPSLPARETAPGCDGRPGVRAGQLRR